jgi:hypothetical protein
MPGICPAQAFLAAAMAIVMTREMAKRKIYERHGTRIAMTGLSSRRKSDINTFDLSMDQRKIAAREPSYIPIQRMRCYLNRNSEIAKAHESRRSAPCGSCRLRLAAPLTYL